MLHCTSITANIIHLGAWKAFVLLCVCVCRCICECVCVCVGRQSISVTCKCWQVSEPSTDKSHCSIVLCPAMNRLVLSLTLSPGYQTHTRTHTHPWHSLCPLTEPSNPLPILLKRTQTHTLHAVPTSKSHRGPLTSCQPALTPHVWAAAGGHKVTRSPRPTLSPTNAHSHRHTNATRR